MKTCECGGMWHRHGEAQSKLRKGGERYKCAACGKTITVRDGKQVSNAGPRVADWRTELPCTPSRI